MIPCSFSLSNNFDLTRSAREYLNSPAFIPHASVMKGLQNCYLPVFIFMLGTFHCFTNNAWSEMSNT